MARTKSLALTLFVVFLFLFNGICTSSSFSTRSDNGTSGSGGGSTSSLRDMAYKTHQQINAYRNDRGLPSLKWSDVVYRECMDHSRSMARSGDLSHSGFSRRAANIRKKTGAGGCAENVAFNWNASNPVANAVRSWINSSGHHKNLTGNFSHTAVAVARAANGAYYFTQMFYKQGRAGQ